MVMDNNSMRVIVCD